MISELIINCVISLSITLILVANVLKQYHKNNLSKINLFTGSIGFGYLILTVFSFLWTFGNLQYGRADFSLIFSLIILLQTVMLFLVSRSINKFRNLTGFLLFYIVILLSAYISLSYISLQIMIISFLLTFIFSININSIHRNYKKTAHLGIMYSSVSIILQFLIFFGVIRPFIAGIVSNFIFLFFIKNLLKQLGENTEKIKSKEKKEESFIVLFIKYFVYIIVITNLVLISTVGVHEFSHVFTARAYGCESRSIIYEENLYPYTEIICSQNDPTNLITLSAVIFPVIIGIALFFIGEDFIRSISLLVIGFNLVASYKDLQEVGLSQNLSFGVTLLGISFLTIGLILLAKFGIKEKMPHIQHNNSEIVTPHTS